jgi:predicted TPR repeat methyltransferase
MATPTADQARAAELYEQACALDDDDEAGVTRFERMLTPPLRH